MAVSALSVVVIDKGGTEALALCTAKRCATPRPEQDKANVVSFISPKTDGFMFRAQRLMYGRDSDDLETTRPTPNERVRLVATNDEIADALGSADAFIVVANESPVDTGNLVSAFSYAGSLKHVLLMSKQDVSGGGSLFGGGKDFKEAEEGFRDFVNSRGSSLSILRCGILKGGGQGYSNLGGRLEGFEDKPETGLSLSFYNNNFDLANAMTTIQHDRFTLGADMVKGDPNKMPNFFMATAKKDSTEASPTDTNICTAAVVATSLVELCHENPALANLEISLGCNKSAELATVDDIAQKLTKLI